HADTFIIFRLRFLTGYRIKCGAKTAFWITDRAISGHSRDRAQTATHRNSCTSFRLRRGDFSCLGRAMHKIFSKIARPISTCLALFGPARLVLSGVKAAPPIIPDETIRSRAGYSASSMPGHGASDGNSRSLAQIVCRPARIGHALVRASRGPL